MGDSRPDELLRRFRDDGDEAAFRALFRVHTPQMLGLALRMLGGDRASAEDAVQEAWLRAASRIAGFEGRSRLSTWLCGFVVNVVREQRRGQVRDLGRDLGRDLAEGEEPGPTPGGTPEHGLDLAQAVAALPAGYRDALLLHDVCGFTHGEIAAQLGIAEGTSRSQLFLARRAVRRRLGSAYGA